jgi:hypothetical protein
VPTASHKKTAQRSATHRIAIASLWPGAKRALHLWHLASLDAPTVALVWAFSFAWAAGTRLPLHTAVIIALVVFAVYVCDRLLDGRAAIGSQVEDRLRERHYFHWQHKRVLAPLAVAAAAVAAILVFACIPVVARERGSALAAVSLAYMARVHQSQFSFRRSSRPLFPLIFTKEMLVGVFFAVGCALPAMSSALAASVATRFALLGTLALFAALAWLNCIAIEQWESESPRHNGPALRTSAYCLATIGLAAAIVLCPMLPRVSLLLIAAAVSAMLIALLDRTRSFLSPVTLRALADFVLLTPALLIPVTRMVR